MADANELLKVVLEYSHPYASTIMNVFYWQIKEAVDDGDILPDFEAWAEDVWGANWAVAAADIVELISVSCDIVLGDGTVDRVLGTSVLSLAGAGATDPMHAQVAASIFGNTARPKTRGRKFIPGMTEGQTTDGRWNATMLGRLAVLLADYLSDYSGTVSYTPGVLSTVDDTFVPFVLAGGFDDVPDNQSRRRPDRGG